MSNFDLPAFSADLLRQPRLQGFESLGPRVQDPERTGGAAAPVEGGEATSAAGFEGALASSLGKLDELRDAATEKTRALMLGEDVDLHDVMLATSKSEVAFNLMLEVRNKLVDAWEKLSRSAV